MAWGAVEVDLATGEYTQLRLFGSASERRAWIGGAAAPGRARTERAGKTVKELLHFRVVEGRRLLPVLDSELAGLRARARWRGTDAVAGWFCRKCGARDDGKPWWRHEHMLSCAGAWFDRA